jgi:hypothetical protein
MDYQYQQSIRKLKSCLHGRIECEQIGGAVCRYFVPDDSARVALVLEDERHAVRYYYRGSSCLVVSRVRIEITPDPIEQGAYFCRDRRSIKHMRIYILQLTAMRGTDICEVRSGGAVRLVFSSRFDM